MNIVGALPCFLWSHSFASMSANSIHMYGWTVEYSTDSIIFSFLLFLHFIYHQNSISHHYPLLSSTFAQVAASQPRSHRCKSYSLPGALASQALLWETPTVIKPGTPNANVQPHSNWKPERPFLHRRERERESHNHTVCNADSYTCDIDIQQSARLPFHPPTGQCYFWLRLGHMSLGSVHTAWLIRATSKKA